MTSQTDLKNGANLIVLDPDNRILVVKEVSRKKLWMLPGGEVERGESPRHAAMTETEEESGIIVDEATFGFVGFFGQRPKGVVFLYETRVFSGELITEPTEDTSEARFMSLVEIIEKGEAEFRTSTLRMILRHKRCQIGIDKMPYEGRLSDIVEFPRHLNGHQYRDIVLSV